MSDPTPVSSTAADEKVAISRRALEKLIKEIYTAHTKGWQVDLKPEYGLPKMLVLTVEKMLEAVRNLMQGKDAQIMALGYANMRTLFLSEALIRLNEIDETGKQSADAKKKSYCDALNEIMCAVSAHLAVLFFVDGRGLITEIYSQGFAEASDKSDYTAMLAAFITQFAANDCKPLIINEANAALKSLVVPTGHPPLTQMLACPITFNNNKQLRGVLYFANKTDATAFGENEIMVSDLFIREIFNVRDRMRLTRQLQHEKAEQGRLLNEIQCTQEQLLQSEKMASIGQLAAGVAHEINNPVGYISSNISTMQNYLANIFNLLEKYQATEEFLPDDKRQQMAADRKTADLEFISEDVNDLVRESIEGVTRVKQIVSDLKNFSRVDETEWAYADLHQCIDSTLNIAHNETKYKAEIVKYYGDIPKVSCIAAQINQVVLNLLVNAAHAMKSHGTITITTQCENDQVKISVADTGCGIPEENITRIFDPFFTSKPVGEGTGLGLSLSYGIIEKHSGKIEVASELGKGTVFTITLPVNQAKK